MTGLIVKALSGFYYCEADGIVYECHARGIFRNGEASAAPLVGDWAEFDPEDGHRGWIVSLLPRRNEFARPPLANLDQLFIVASVVEPQPSTLVIDKLLAVCEYKDIEPVLVVTKTDLGDAAPLVRIYDGVFPVIALSNGAGDEPELARLREKLAGRVSAFCGNTGVGKSSLLNRLYPELELQTGAISKKLGRGRHTTRHVELYAVSGGWAADTPGFGTMELSRYDMIRKEQLQYCFREFEPYREHCRFTGCSHSSEKGCAVLEALRAGKIPPTRHESYVKLYQDALLVKEWEHSPHGK